MQFKFILSNGKSKLEYTKIGNDSFRKSQILTKYHQHINLLKSIQRTKIFCIKIYFFSNSTKNEFLDGECK